MKRAAAPIVLAEPVVRAQVGETLWWQAQPEPKIGEQFRGAGGKRHRIVNVWPSDGGWLYTTEATS